MDITTLPLKLPPSGAANQKSFFVVGLHKAGSTLVTEIFRRIAPGYRYAPYDLHQAIHSLGLRVPDVAIQPGGFFQPFGYAFIGFRGWPKNHSAPNWCMQRVVHLVRDPRDVLVSMYFSVRSSHTVPTTPAERPTILRETFDEYRRTAHALGIDEFVLAWADKVYKEYTETLDVLQPFAPRIWRYEDIIFNKTTWVEEMLRHLQMQPPPKDVLGQILQPFDVLPSNEDPERHIRQVKPGDHKGKLAKSTIEQLSDRFAPILSRHGYA